MLGARQSSGLFLGDALEADLVETNANGAPRAERAGLAPHAVPVPGIPSRTLLGAKVGVTARVPASVACQ